jgi:hypothetical protein
METYNVADLMEQMKSGRYQYGMGNSTTSIIRSITETDGKYLVVGDTFACSGDENLQLSVTPILVQLKPMVEDYFSGECAAFETLAEALKHASVKRITGRILTATDEFKLKAGVVEKKKFSKKRLEAVLEQNGFGKSVSYEAYGRDVRAFIGTDKRTQLEAFLRLLGQSVDESYAPGRNVVECKVTFFKAWHWDE